MHGGDVYSFAAEQGIKPETVLDFSANMNDFIRIRNLKINSVFIKNYPENNLNAYKSLVSEGKFKNENIAIIPGLTSFIHSFMSYINGNSIIISPAFTEYINAHTDSYRVVFPFDIINKNPEIIENYNFNTLFLVYPDNPTGQLISKESLIKILDICVKKKSRLFLDESFIWFVNKREIDEAEFIRIYPNLIIGRSLTKILSIPGLRLAYILSSSENINEIEKTLSPWGINQPALLYLRNCDMNFYGIAQKTEVERNYVIKSLEKLGFSLIGSPRANFATFRMPGKFDVIKLREFLAKNRMMIRVLEEYPEFGINYIRIGIKKREKNRSLIKFIREYAGEFHD